MLKKEKWYNEIESTVCILIICFMLVILTWQVFSRFLLDTSYGWIDELSRYGLVWFAYAAACYAIIHDQHIKIDLLLAVWPQKVRKFIKLFSNVIFFIYAVAVSYYSSLWVLGLKKMGTLSLGTQLPMWAFSLVIPLAHILMAIRLVQLEIKYIKHPELLEAKEEPIEKEIETQEVAEQ